MGTSTWILTYQGLSGYCISACPTHLQQKQMMNLWYDRSIKEPTSCLFVSLLLPSPIFWVWVCVFCLESLNWPPLSRDLCVWVLSCFSHVQLFVTPWTTNLLCPWDSPGKNTRVGCHAVFQGIFPIQGLNPHPFCLLHWQVGALPLVPPGKPTPPDLYWVRNSGNRTRQSVVTCFRGDGYTLCFI